MIESAKMSMKGWAASTTLCPKKNHINKKMGMGENNASKSNKPLYLYLIILLSGKTQITYKSLRNCLYIGNSAFFFEFQAP